MKLEELASQFKINRVFFDKQAKEYVLITNGKCRLDHAHEGLSDCDFVASEGIALRLFIEDNGKPSFHWTYRGVDYTQLEAAKQETWKPMFEKALASKKFTRI